jgi:hypothetical protein
MRIRSIAVTGLLLLFPFLILAQQKKIYLDPNDDFSAYFSSAIHKKKVPVTVTTDPQQADYTAQFQAKASDGTFLQGILSSLGQGGNDIKSFNEVVMTIVEARSKDVVFSYTCRKVSQNMGGSSALATSVAECLAKHWKDSIH